MLPILDHIQIDITPHVLQVTWNSNNILFYDRKGVHRCLHHAAPHQEMEEGELMGIRGVAF